MGSWHFLGDHDGSPAIFLLTDGSVLCESVETLGLSRFRPDRNGDYSRGRWTAPTPRLRALLSPASVVLADGRVLVPDRLGVEIFNPVTNLSETVRPDARLNVGNGAGQRVIESAVCVLNDGQVLLELRDLHGARAGLYDPARNTWIQVSDPVGRVGRGVLLASGAVLTLSEGRDRSSVQMYWPDRNEWSDAGDVRSRALGPLLPDGRVLTLTDRIMFFTPPTTSRSTGVLSPGPEFPARDSHGWPLSSVRSPVCLLPSGRILYGLHYLEPRSAGHRGARFNLVFYEFDPARSVFSSQEDSRFVYASFAHHGLDLTAPVIALLPTGQVLVNAGGGARVDVNIWALYSPDAAAVNDLWKPRITDCHSDGMQRHSIYEIAGVRFNGVSQAASTNATNYPIVQLRGRANPPGRLWYCRTFSHSSMGVATGEARVGTHIELPSDAPLGPAQLRVVANGIASDWCDTSIYDPHNLIEPTFPELWNRLVGNFADGPIFIIGPHGIKPIPPWDPGAKQIRAAYDRILPVPEAPEALGEEEFGQDPLGAKTFTAQTARPREEYHIEVYEQLCNSYRAIDDFRAKLLGFLPLATGTGVFLLLSDGEKIVLLQHFFQPMGIFGFVITLGLFFYELYGIKKCTHLIRAGKALEKELRIENGQFSKRPLGVVGLINEPLASGVIYPAVLAAWTFLAFAFRDSPPGRSQNIAPVKISDVAEYWAIRVFLAGFAVSLFYNLFLIAEAALREAFVRLKAWIRAKQASLHAQTKPKSR